MKRSLVALTVVLAGLALAWHERLVGAVAQAPASSAIAPVSAEPGLRNGAAPEVAPGVGSAARSSSAAVTSSLPVASAGPVHTALDDVRACLPLADGRVLAGSAGGLWLVAADGRIEHVWTALDGLPETRVNALLEDGDGPSARGGKTLFIGTEAGLAEVTLEGTALEVRRTMASKPVRALLRHDGELFAGTWGDGVMRLDRGRGRLQAVGVRKRRANDRGLITSLASWERSVVAGTAGAGVYHLAGDSLEPLAPSRAGEERASVWSLVEHEGRLWVGTLEGVASYADGHARREGGADVRALAVVGGALWAGTYGQGVMRHDGRRLVDAAAIAVTSADAASSGGALFVQAIGARGATRCLGTKDGLLIDRGDGASFQAVRSPGLPSNDVAAIAIDGDRIWAGTFDRGLAVLEAGRWRRVADERIDAKVNAVAVERVAAGSRVWVATARGLVRIEGARIERLTESDGLPSSDVHAVSVLRDGGVLAGTSRGAAVLRGGAVELLGKTGGLPPGAVWSVAEGPGGMLLLGTSRGLLHGSPGGEWHRVSMSSGHLRDDWVTALHVRGDTVWAGTYNAGVEELSWKDPEFSVRHLGGGYVNLAGVLADGETLYAATMEGLLSRPVDADASVEWSVLRRAAPGRDVTAIVRRGAELWVASRRGIKTSSR